MSRMLTMSRRRHVPALSNDVFDFGPPEVRRRAFQSAEACRASRSAAGQPAVMSSTGASAACRDAGKAWDAYGVASPSPSPKLSTSLPPTPSPSPYAQPAAFTHADAAGHAQEPWAAHAVAAAQDRAHAVVGDLTRALGDIVKVMSQCMHGPLRRQREEQREGDGSCEGAAAAAADGEEVPRGTEGVRTSCTTPTSTACSSPRAPARASAPAATTTAAHGPGASGDCAGGGGGSAAGGRRARRGSVRGSPDLMRRFVRRMTFKPHTTSSVPYVKWLRAVKWYARYNASRRAARARRQLAGVRQIKLRGSRGWFIPATDCAGRPASRPSSPLTVIGGGSGGVPDAPDDLSVDWAEGFDEVDDADDLADGWLTEDDSADGAGCGWCGDVKVDTPEPAVGLPLDVEAHPLEWDVFPGDRPVRSAERQADAWQEADDFLGDYLGSAERRAHAWHAYRNRTAEPGAWLSGSSSSSSSSSSSQTCTGAGSSGGSGAYTHLPSDLFDEEYGKECGRPPLVPCAEDDEMPPLIPCSEDEEYGGTLDVRTESAGQAHARFTHIGDASADGASSPTGVCGLGTWPTDLAGQTDAEARLAELCRQQVSLSAAFSDHWARFGYP